jgi:A/G-specific adenine glycosylase
LIDELTLQDITSIQEALLAWYSKHQRDLPWRENIDPYSVWISEIMLQQTTVAAVIPFFTRWMQRFPTIEALANSPVDDVLVHWAGLGYYARARNLHKAACVIVANYSGTMPQSVEDLVSLPGIGAYTSAAIASIAFGVDVAAVDANVIRVVSRLGAIPGDPVHETASRRAVNALALKLVPSGKASEFNQAMMDLGSSICLSDRADCDRCPLAGNCNAKHLGNPTRFPAIAKKAKTDGQRDVSVAIYDDLGKLFLVQRPHADPLWGGLWELPRVTAYLDESLQDAAVRAASIVGDTGTLLPFGSVRHIVANRKITLYGYRAPAKLTRIKERNAPSEWTATGRIGAYAMATPQRRLIEQYTAIQQQSSLDLGDFS